MTSYRDCMGLFSRNQEKVAAQAAKETERGRAASAKAAAKAGKKQLNVAEALAVGHTIDDGAEQFLIVHLDSVELINRGKLGSVFKSGAGSETIPMTRVSSVECRNQGIWNVLEVHTSNSTITFKTDVVTGPYLRQVIADQARDRAAGQPTPGREESSVDPTEQLHKLAGLHQGGVLTDDEFAAKKAELLERM